MMIEGKTKKREREREAVLSDILLLEGDMEDTP